MRIIPTVTDFESEYRQFGRNTADRCRATFLTLLHSRTSAPHLIAAAERGRREVLEKLPQHVGEASDWLDDVRIIIHRGPVIVARVRDDAGVHDVEHAAEGGWSCGTCRNEYRCVHAHVVSQVTEAER